MLRYYFMLCCLVLFSTEIFAQKLELDRVSKSELLEKQHKMDTSASAAILFKKCKISYDNSTGKVLEETDVKLKIYKKEGYKYANIKDRIYEIGSSETVDFSNAYTYNLVDGEIVKSKLKREGEFKEELTKELILKKITMPDVREGSIIEYKIKRYSNRIFQFVDFYFQQEIPINSIELKVEYSDRFYYNKMLTGFLSPETSFETFEDSNSNFSQSRYTYKLKNVKALKDEGFINNINNYRSRVRFELTAVKNKYGISENLSNDWQTVVKNVYKIESFGEELKKTGYFEKELDALLNGITSDDKKITAIFNFVKDRMNWNDYYGYSCQNGVKKAYKDRLGNVADINLMLISFLRYAQIEANPILISTRSNGVAISPSLTSYNYVIAGIEIQNKVLLLDATDKNALPDIVPIRILNWFGRIIRENESSAEINLMPTINSIDVISLMGNINEEGEVSGKIREQYYDYNAFLHRNKDNGLTKESAIEKLEKLHLGIEIGEYEIQNVNDLSKQVIENYDFKTSNTVEIIGDKMYFSPFLFLAMTENPFKQEVREYPVDFVYPNQDKYNISLKIPDGYTVEILPKSLSIAMPDNLGSFKYNISNKGNQIQLLSTLDINQAIIGAEYYEELKSFYKEIVEKQTEKIVLKKG